MTATTLNFSPGCSATFNAGSSSWTITNWMYLNSLTTFNANSSSISVAGDMTFDPATKFNAGTSTMTFNGTGTQTISVSTRTFATVAVTNTSAGGVRFLESIRASTFTALIAGSTIQFNTGTSSVTVTGFLNIGAAAGAKVGLHSRTEGTRWKIALTAGASQQVRNADIKDSDASLGQTIYADDGTSINSGNNLNWVFGPPTFSTITWVSASSITVAYSSASSPDAYMLEISTESAFTIGTFISSSTANFAPFALTMGALTPLIPNTTYFLRTGALYGSVTTYAATLSTYTYPVMMGSSITVVSTNSITLALHRGANTAGNYNVQISTDSAFGETLPNSYVFSSTSALTEGSTTYGGLLSGATYFVKTSILWSGQQDGLVQNASGYVSLTTATLPVLGQSGQSSF